MTADQDTLTAKKNGGKIHEQTERNRLNQRNFRRRRQERVQELEERVRQCQQARIEATREVQNAARVVVNENTILRDYLKEELGFTDESIATLVQRGRQRVVVDHKSSTLVPTTTWESKSPDHFQDIEILARVYPISKTPPVTICGSDRQVGSEINGRMPSPYHYGEVAPHCARQSEPDTSDQSTTIQDNSASVPGVQASSVNRGINHTVSMSCEKAAEILSGLRSYNENDELRVELGCTSTRSCNIDNVRLLEIMSES